MQKNQLTPKSALGENGHSCPLNLSANTTDKNVRSPLKYPNEARIILALVILVGWLYVGVGIANKGLNSRGIDLSMLFNPNPTLTTSKGYTLPIPCACPGWPFDPFTAAAVQGMAVSSEPFFKNVPDKMVKSGFVLDEIKVDVLPRTNITMQAVQLFRNGAKERGASIDTPFPVFGANSLGVWCTGMLSVGDEHGWEEGEEDWRHEFWVARGKFEVRPDISTNSAVLYGTVYTNGLPASFVVRWQNVYYEGNPALCCTFEAEFFKDSEDVVYRFFAGCDALAIQENCAMGVMMSGEGWSTSGMDEYREIRLKRLKSVEEEKKLRIQGLKITEFEAWYHKIDTTLSYKIPPGWLLYWNLCPHHIENAMAALPPDIVDFINNYPVDLADLLMKYVINPFEWTPDPAILSTVTPTSNPSHTLLTPGNGKVPIYISQTAPIAEDTLALLTVGQMRLQLSDVSTTNWTLYITRNQTYAFSLRSIRNPDVKLSLSNQPPSGGASNPPHVWVDDPDNVFGLGAFVAPGSRGEGGNVAFRVQSGGGGSRDGGTGSGALATSTGKLVPVDPNGSNHLCVHGDTGWHKMEVTCDGNTYPVDDVTWSNIDWELDEDGAKARLIVGNASSATLIGTGNITISGLAGQVTASNTFYKCGASQCDDPSHGLPGIYFKSWSTNNFAPPLWDIGAFGVAISDYEDGMEEDYKVKVDIVRLTRENGVDGMQLLGDLEVNQGSILPYERPLNFTLMTNYWGGNAFKSAPLSQGRDTPHVNQYGSMPMMLPAVTMGHYVPSPYVHLRARIIRNADNETIAEAFHKVHVKQVFVWKWTPRAEYMFKQELTYEKKDAEGNQVTFTVIPAAPPGFDMEEAKRRITAASESAYVDNNVNVCFVVQNPKLDLNKGTIMMVTVNYFETHDDAAGKGEYGGDGCIRSTGESTLNLWRIRFVMEEYSKKNNKFPDATPMGVIFEFSRQQQENIIAHTGVHEPGHNLGLVSAKFLGGEDYERDKNGNYVLNEKGNKKQTPETFHNPAGKFYPYYYMTRGFYVPLQLRMEHVKFNQWRPENLEYLKYRFPVPKTTNP